MICRNCGVNNPEENQNCCNCGCIIKKAEINKRKFKKIIILSILSPFILYLFLCFLWSMSIILSPNPPKPISQHGEFPFHLVYDYNGELYTVDDTLICDYIGIKWNQELGKYIKWDYYLKSGNNQLSGSGFILFDGVKFGWGNTYVTIELGKADYYLGYKEYENYSPGSIKTSYNKGKISDDYLWDYYKIRIIESSFSQPLNGNKVLEQEHYLDVARSSVKGVDVYSNEISYPVGTQQIVFTWENNTDKQIKYQQSFFIQKLIDGEWRDVYRDIPVSFEKDQLILEPHSTIEYTCDVSKYTKDITYGKYRIVTYASTPVIIFDSSFHNEDICVLCGNFIIK